jgi:hypothetical protein
MKPNCCLFNRISSPIGNIHSFLTSNLSVDDWSADIFHGYPVKITAKPLHLKGFGVTIPRLPE